MVVETLLVTVNVTNPLAAVPVRVPLVRQVALVSPMVATPLIMSSEVNTMLSRRVAGELLSEAVISPCQFPATLVKLGPPDVVALSPLVQATMDREQKSIKNSLV